MKRYLFDTNILIYYFADTLPVQEIPRIEHILKESFNISIITKIEFFGFEKYSQDEFSRELEFIGHATVIPLTDEIADSVIDIRRKTRIQIPDAVIAATCLTEDLTLITRNEKDFRDIAGLDIYNPFTGETS
ncbi:MAG: type II toxin-antitoxin system VapC family toxin [Methanoregula sp.]|uniref:type II toxin-antitoxin system VapC family toxin n=1 Tax=Methanoregula sp. TaxID=2052170 RepID=UPI0025D6FBE5|nr:type II toxin-antitoxin system VapC family toxin [Methanoregula sp.]MCK9632144.1 type II toxin-antitoxin system VapC family toxin [Methanoregula sp.]